MPEFIRNLIEQFGERRRVLIPLVGVGAILVLWAVVQWSSGPEWVPLMRNVPLEEVADITDRLDEGSIPYRLEKAGTELWVQAPDLARARVSLARDGLPSKGAPGFELFDQPSWGMTDFAQRVNYRRALEGELERTIREMRGVEGVQVHLAMRESSVFQNQERPSEASVVLRLGTGARPGRDLVDGIKYLVASSVDGVRSENVTVLDDSGRLLSATLEPGSLAGLTARQLDMRREVEAYLENKAEELVAQMVGAENVRVRVAAEMSFDRLDRTVRSVEPDEQVITREERSEIIPGPESEGAGQVVTETEFDLTRRIERFTSGLGTIKRLTVSVLLNTPEAEGEEGGEAGGAASWPDAQLTRVEELVRNAVGFNAARGDAISVVSLPFSAGPAVPATDDGFDLWSLVGTLQRPLIAVLALVLAFILATRVLRALRPPEPVEPARQLASGKDGEEEALEAPEEEEVLQLPTHALAEAELEGREVLAANVIKRPEVTARLIRSWMRES